MNGKRKEPAAAVDETGWTIVYTDGASKDNGKPSARAGVGVWYGEDDPR